MNRILSFFRKVNAAVRLAFAPQPAAPRAQNDLDRSLSDGWLDGPEHPAMVKVNPAATATNLEPRYIFMGEAGRPGRRAIVHETGSEAHAAWIEREFAAFREAIADQVAHVIMEQLIETDRLHTWEPSWDELITGSTRPRPHPRHDRKNLEIAA